MANSACAILLHEQKRGLRERGVWSGDSYSTSRSRVLYGSRHPNTSSRKSRSERHKRTHYVFYCDFVGASELGPAAAVAGCFLAKAHHPRAAETYACCAATRSRWTSSTRSICVLTRTFLTLYYTIEFNKSITERSILFIRYTSHITRSYSTGGSFDPPTQVTINIYNSMQQPCETVF